LACAPWNKGDGILSQAEAIVKEHVMGLRSSFRVIRRRLLSPHRPALRPHPECLEDRTMLAAGDVDPGFGAAGLVLADLGANEQASAVAVQDDGRIVIAGSSSPNGAPSNGSFIVARFNADGSRDDGSSGDSTGGDSFGIGGRTITDFGSGLDVARAVHVYPASSPHAGKVLVTGRAAIGSNVLFALARYNADGNPDDGDSTDGTPDITPSDGFGTGGVVTTSFSFGVADARSLAVQPDGRIVVAGEARINGSGHMGFALARYESNGSLDVTFGTGGKLTTSFGGQFAGAADVALQPDGKIVVAGATDSAAAFFQFDFALARYDTSGNLDPTFGSGGRVTTAFSNASNAVAVAIYPASDPSHASKIVAAGSVPGAAYDFAVARYNPDGTLDDGGPSDSTPADLFGTAGRVVTDFIGYDDLAHDLVLQPDGKFVVAGQTLVLPEPGHTDFALIRYNADGALDNGFGSGGKVTSNFRPGAAGNAPGGAFGVTLQTDGKIVAAGVSDTDIALTRFLGDGSGGGGGPTPPTDSDDDGVLDPIEDGAAHGGDGNGDGIPDSQQANVASLPNAVDGLYVTLEAPAGTRLIGVRNRDIPPPTGVVLPVGAFEYVIDGVTSPDGSAVVNLYLPPGTAIDSFYKYGATWDDALYHWYEFDLDVSSNSGAEIFDEDGDTFSDRVVLHFVDGARGDSDLTRDGRIVDPGAPASAAGPQGGEISGVVFHDVDGDSIYGIRDGRLSGWTVFLDDNRDGIFQTDRELSVVTDAMGSFHFTGLGARTYTVAVEVRPDWQTTAPRRFGESTIGVGGRPTYVAVGDVDKDRYDDFVALVPHRPPGEVGVFRNELDGTFTERNAFNVTGASLPRAVAIGELSHITDLSNLGALYADLVFSKAPENTAEVFLGNAIDSFDRVPTQFATGASPSGVIVADFDGDGLNDVVTADSDDDTISFLKGQGDGALADPIAAAVGDGPEALVAGHFNFGTGPGLDNSLDLAVADRSSQDISILLGNGDGSFRLVQTISLNGGLVEAGAITTGQFNPQQDDYADLAVVMPDVDTVAILLGTGLGQFQMATIAVGDTPVSVVTLRLNNDAFDDLAVANAGASSLTTLLGDGHGSFVRQQDLPLAHRPQHIAAGDLDRNQFPDLVATNPAANAVSVLRANPHQSHTVRVGNNPVVTGVNFGKLSLFDGSISGVKWEDLDGDGVRESFEPVLDVRSIYLDVNNDGFSDRSTLTDESGRYVFANVAPGEYHVFPAGSFREIVTSPPGGVYAVTVGPDEHPSGYDFGSQFSPGSIHGYVWEDQNGNGLRDDNGDSVFDEPGRSGVTVFLDLNENGSRDSGEPNQLTDDNGEYSFASLSTRYTYLVAQETPAGFVQTFPGFDQRSGQRIDLQSLETASANFGIALTAEIIGNKFIDDDGDGQRDPGEAGVPGAVIWADMNHNFQLDAGEPSATTDTNGDYHITGVTPGTWNVLDSQSLVTLANGASSGAFGFSVAASPTHLAVGDPLGVEGGAVFLRGPAGPVQLREFGGGFSVAVLDDRLFVGAPNLANTHVRDPFVDEPTDPTDVGLGAVVVYDIPSGLQTGLVLGQEYDLGDDTAQIDAGVSLAAVAGERPTVLVGGGRVVDQLSAPDAHVVQHYLGPNPGIYFGESVAGAGSFVLVGAPGDTRGSIQNAGVAFLFEQPNEFDFPQFAMPVEEFRAPAAVGDGSFGLSVAARGDWFLSGAPEYGDQHQGLAYLYQRSGQPINDVPLRTFESPDPDSFDRFGFSVTFVGDRVVVGAPFDDTMAQDAGAAYVFDTDTGELIDRLFSPNPRTQGLFGFSVAAVADEAILIGEPSPGVPMDPGAAYLFPMVDPVAIPPDHVTAVNFLVQNAPWDRDGVGNSVEDRAPNGGDGNRDGISDSQQWNVTSLPSSIGSGFLTVAAPWGTRLANVRTFEEFAPGGSGPLSYSAPVGLVGFTLENLAADGTADVELFPHSNPVINSYYKFGKSPDNPTPHIYEFLFDGTTGAEFFDADNNPVAPHTSAAVARIVLHLVDGQRGDDDLDVNGVLVDPGAPVLVVSPLTLSAQGSVNESDIYSLGLSADGMGSDAVSGWTVSWGDGTSSSVSGGQAVAQHQYDGPNTYTVSAAAHVGSLLFPADNMLDVIVLNVPPTATFTNHGPVPSGTSALVTFSDAYDPSVADTAAGFLYSYDFNNDGDFTDPGELAGVAATVAAVPLSSPGSYTVRGRVADKDGGFTDYLSTVVVLPSAGVASVVINDGHAQRSKVNSIMVTFDALVQLGAGAFELHKVGVHQPIALDVSLSTTAGRTVATITFHGHPVIAGSLDDGRYRLLIHGDQIHIAEGLLVDADGDGRPGGERVDAFFRLFGDTDGDGDVDARDLGVFASAFGTRSRDRDYLWYLDFDDNNRILALDLVFFLLNYGSRI
jgi:uncharacterized delta-60 repeat protein